MPDPTRSVDPGYGTNSTTRRSEVLNRGGRAQRIAQPVMATSACATPESATARPKQACGLERLHRTGTNYDRKPAWRPGTEDAATSPESNSAARRQHEFASTSVQSPLHTYLTEINETPLLTAEEERLLAVRIEQGDSDARDHMVRANLRLVVNIARSYTGTGLGLQDLIAEGNLGLMRAVEGFDPSMNTRFSTYASYWIKQSIKRAVINTGKMIRIPAYMNELLTKWRRATATLQDKLGRNPSNEEVAASLKLPKKKLRIMKQAIRIYNGSPQTPRAEEGRTIDEMIMDDHAMSPETNLIKEDDLRQVMDLLSKIDKREAGVLRLRFGLDGEEPKTLKEIGERLGLTRERVRQIESEALKKLSETMQAENRPSCSVSPTAAK